MGKGIRRCTSLICSVVMLTSIGGVFATWKYASGQAKATSSNFQIGINQFDYQPPMPEGDSALLQRLDDILNQVYTTEEVKDAKKYLLEETIKVEWEDGSAPYVGSMDSDFSVQINELFGDILSSLNVSFILKNEDLNYDGFNEIALYSTSDPLDCVEQGYIGIVGVYLSVFTPIVDEQKNVIGYQLVCDSMYGFCNEVHYNPEHLTDSSFSTDDWRDNIVYWHHELDTQPMPDDAIAIDGKSLFKYHYESYHSRQYMYEGYPWDTPITNVWVEGKTAAQMLANKIPWIG